MLDILVEYYKTAYELMNFRKPFTADLDNSITVQDRINQYGRCRIGSEIFGSAMSSRHIKSSFVLAQFVNQDGSCNNSTVSMPQTPLYFLYNGSPDDPDVP